MQKLDLCPAAAVAFIVNKHVLLQATVAQDTSLTAQLTLQQPVNPGNTPTTLCYQVCSVCYHANEKVLSRLCQHRRHGLLHSTLLGVSIWHVFHPTCILSLISCWARGFSQCLFTLHAFLSCASIPLPIRAKCRCSVGWQACAQPKTPVTPAQRTSSRTGSSQLPASGAQLWLLGCSTAACSACSRSCPAIPGQPGTGPVQGQAFAAD